MEIDLKYKDMKRFYYITALFLAIALCAQAQDPNERTPRMSRGGDRARQQQEEKNNGMPELSVRAQIMNEQLTQEVGNARWMRVVMRELDLTDEKNAPLYYPVQETNGMVNFFTTLFHLVSEGKIEVYRYLSEKESFEDDNILPFNEMLTNFSIYHEEVPAGGGRPARYVINASDIPSEEVRKLYVKEAWYFDQHNSVYDVKTLAICPIAYTLTDNGEERRPMFWAKYEDVRPYVKNNYIMTSNINNAKTFTVDDFFRLRMFDGEIVKTENLLNLALIQYCPTPDSLKAEQERIENQLKTFSDSLWIQPDTTTVMASSKSIKKAKRSAKETGVSTDNKSSEKEKAPKQPKAQTAKATKSSPSRSIRR